MSQVKLYKPTTPGRRKTSVTKYRDHLTESEPYKKLTYRQKRNAGRNGTGKITVRHQGGGYKKQVRIVDFKRKFTEGFKVLSVEYDPGRSGFISLVSDLRTGEKAYVLNTKGMKVGDKLGTNTNLDDGNGVSLSMVPIGTFVSQVEINPGQGAKLIRSAGNYAVVTAKDSKFVTLKLPSGEIRKFLNTCKCVINRVSNESWELVRLGKAGRNRHMGVRPTVRGKVMNPVDHPHGGGEARNSIGMKYPKTPWGKHALGVRTRDPKKASGKHILKKRYQK